MLFLHLINLNSSHQMSKIRFLEAFRVSKVSDLMRNFSVGKIVGEVFEKVSKGGQYLYKADLFKWVDEHNGEDEEIKETFMGLVRAYMS